MDWKQFLAYSTGLMDQGLLLARHRKPVAQKFIDSGQRKRPRRPHQGRDNVVLMPAFAHMQATTGGSRIRCRERLSGLLTYYDRAAA